MPDTLKITECPRDAMQGIHEFIPTQQKIEYLNALLEVGFDTLDFGSFVSPKAIPQMKDTADVLKHLNLVKTKTKLLAIIANVRGAHDACKFEEITYLGFPFSISETFQHRNTNSSIQESLARVEEIQRLCVKHNKQLLIYISMAFGNPYGDHWHEDIAIGWCRTLHKLGINRFALADTTGSSNPAGIRQLFTTLIAEMKQVEIGAHLHSTKEHAQEKIKAAYESGCRSFDVAIHGFGGCPMAREELTGNIATQELERFASENNVPLHLDHAKLNGCYEAASKIFEKFH
jgi:hydroxymethylglutaryl-CoA lyase